MHHQLTNQELARLRYADAIRNSTRHVVLDQIESPPARSPRLVVRVRGVIGNLFAQAPAPRPLPH